MFCSSAAASSARSAVASTATDGPAPLRHASSGRRRRPEAVGARRAPELSRIGRAHCDAASRVHSRRPIGRRAHDRRSPVPRDYASRAFTVGIGGPVGSGKTALLLALCRLLRDDYNIGVVTNDIFTKEDAEFLVRNHALPAERIRAVETCGCPHAAIREDITPNLDALEELMSEY